MDAKIDIDPLLECLLVLSAFHGEDVNRESLISGLPLEQSHLTPALFGRAAARAGLASKILSKPLNQLRKRALPAILLLDGDEACVLMGWSRDKRHAQVVFPELSETVEEIPLEQLQESYSGLLIYARPRFNFDGRTDQVGTGTKGHWFWSAMVENLGLYRDVLVAAFFINVFALALPLFAMNVYDRVVPNRAIETLWMLAIGIGIVLCADLLLRTMRGYFLDLAGKRVDLLLSVRLMEQVLGLKLAHKPQSVGAFAANLRSYESIRDFTTSASLTALIDLPFTAIFVLVIGWVAPVMVIPLMVGLAVVVLYALTTQRKMRKLTESMYRASSMRSSVLIESLVGLDTLKSMGAEGMMQRRWEKAAAFLDRIGVQLRLLGNSNLNVALWCQQLVSVSIIVLGVYLIAEGELTLGGLIASTMLSNRAMAPVSQVAGLLTQYHNARTALTALNEVMAKPVERPAGKNFSNREALRGALAFKHVSFSYPEADVASLDDICFSLEPGEHVAVLGRVGSGKTTLNRLLMGLYEPADGAVMVDNIDIRQIDPAQLRHQIGYVPQDATLFYGTLRENLLLGNHQVSQADLDRAVQIADLSEFINRHPQGFDMNVGERGEFLSGGQRKAVALARALIHEPQILLLDEATGSMDHTSEAAILSQLQAYSKGKTLLLTTHRTSMLQLVDRIIVLDQGCIVADGPRDNVMDALRKGRIGRAL
ncbi:type I secretion system permease/ATPase [Pontibacterium granulatum]|uniref:type I secretion system permease/ATPase n=1 Tax=Pontibacterium granulatum TaxID=2036029 RepID=UPI00249BD732|nr:type I secretion system permease/ATPase [Pontibacterium granulatum]MDI3325434.1 type I secretion system permease/ATPase [Pontibacterium granulatum]